MSFPISFITLALGTISWHFHVREVVLDNLGIMDKVKVAPFFLSIIVSKVFVLANTFENLRLSMADCSGCNWHLHAICLLLLIVAIQMTLHLKMKYSTRRSIFGSLANVITLWLPSHMETLQVWSKKNFQLIFCVRYLKVARLLSRWHDHLVGYFSPLFTSATYSSKARSLSLLENLKVLTVLT